ncbi:ATP-binding protein [Salinivibrio kushneri]|uniref:ATP-binding protein n=2 Tax=Salinivibrio kushneri TaxID=1908198 RepID=UPI000985A085|nr:transporter substrate-binding domain-containing protein [Salinivibrio kushneri]OOE61636.1 hypothetical protein BZG18_07465 [Salinivibrio kushneri]
MKKLIFILIFWGVSSYSYSLSLYDDSNLSFIINRVDLHEKDIEKYNGRVIKVGVVDALPPYDIFSKYDNEYRGLSADYLNIIRRVLSLEFKIIQYQSRQEAIRALKEGHIDIIPTSNSYEEYSGLILSLPYKKDNVALYTNSQSAMSPDRIGIYDEYLRDDEVKKAFPNSKIIKYETPKEAISATSLGQVDGVIIDLFSGNYNVNKNNVNNLYFSGYLDFENKGFSFASSKRKEHRELIEKINIIIKEVKRTSFFDVKWSGGGVSVPNHDSMEISRKIKKGILPENKSLKVGLLNYAAPLSYNGGEGNYQGIMVELVELIEIYSGINIDYYFFDSVDEIESALRESKIDFTSLAISEERLKEFVFSKSIVHSEYVKVANIDSDSKSKNKVAYSVSSSSLNSILKELPEKIEVIYVDTYLDALTETFESGDSSFAIVPLLSANYYINKHFSKNLKIDGIYGGGSPATVNFMVINDRLEIKEFLSEMLSIIPENDIDIIFNRWQRNLVPETKEWIDFKSHLTVIVSISVCFLSILFLVSILVLRTYKKRLEIKEHLREQLMFMQMIIDSMPFPIYIKDEELNIIISNVYFETVRDGLYLYGLRSQLEDDDYKRCIGLTYPSVNEVEFFFKGNKYHAYHWVHPYEINASKGLICGWLDITEKQNLLEELALAKDIAESSSKEKSNFVATMSHEIRTPINAILGFLDILLKENPNTKQYQFIKMAMDSARDLSHLVGDILDLSRIESDLMMLSPSANNIKELFNGLYHTYSFVSKEKKINFTCDIDDNIDDLLVFDSVKLKQVLVNLISNAIKYTNEGGVYLSLNLDKKTKDTTYLLIEVKDSGIGIPEDNMERIFDAFSQGSNHSGLGGVGLGLMISKKIFGLMGGDITIKSTQGIGTLVSLTIGLPREKEGNKNKKTSHNDISIMDSKLKVLVVDDYLPNRHLLSYQINHLGCDVKVASSGEEALSLFNNNEFDLVITDCNMPSVNGYDLSKSIREIESEESYRASYILGFTASAIHSVVEKCLIHGMDDCLFKPLSTEKLKEKIVSIINRGKDDHGYKFNKVRAYKLYDYVGSDDNALFELVKRIVKEIEKDKTLVDELLSKENFTVLRNVIHRTKSVSDMLKCDDIIFICNELLDKKSDELNYQDIELFSYCMCHISESLSDLLSVSK